MMCALGSHLIELFEYGGLFLVDPIEYENRNHLHFFVTDSLKWLLPYSW